MISPQNENSFLFFSDYGRNNYLFRKWLSENLFVPSSQSKTRKSGKNPQTSSLMKLTGFYKLSYKTSGQEMNGGAVTDPEVERWVTQAQRRNG